MPEVCKSLGVKIRKLRKASNLTTLQLAEKLNISNGLVNNIENARNDVFKLKLLHKIAETFNISVYELISNESIDLDNLYLDYSDNLNITLKSKNFSKEKLDILEKSFQLIIHLYVDLLTEYSFDKKSTSLITNHIVNELNFIKSINLKNNA